MENWSAESWVLVIGAIFLGIGQLITILRQDTTNKKVDAGTLTSMANSAKLDTVTTKQDDLAIKQDDNAAALDGKLTELTKANVAAAKAEGVQEATDKRAAADASENVGRLAAGVGAAPANPAPPIATEQTLGKVLKKLPAQKKK